MPSYIIAVFLLLGSSVYAQLVITLVDSSQTLFRDDIILDDKGNLYCSDYGGANIYKLSSSGEVSVFATGFVTPNGLAFDSQNNLFVCDNVGSRIYKLDTFGNFVDTFSVDNPSGIIKEFDSDTMIFTNYGFTNVLTKLGPDGSVQITHTGSGLNGAVGLEYDNEGQLYVANFNDRKVFKVFPDSLSLWATVPGPANGALGFLAYGGGYLWATSWHDNKIYGISTNTKDSTFAYLGSDASSLDGSIDSATTISPNGIYATNSGDTIYFNEYNTGKLRMIIPDSESVMMVQAPRYEKVRIYPNPSSSFQELKLETEAWRDIHRIEISDMSGRLIFSFTPEEKLSTIPDLVSSTDKLSTFLVLKVIYRSNTSETFKVLISN